MMFSSKTAAASLAAAGFMVLAGSVSAAVTDIDSMVIVERNWDDFPNSALVTTNNYPTTVQFDESSFDPPDLGTGLYANQHQAWFSADAGATRYAFQNNEGWELSVDVNLDSLIDGSRRKEAGIRMDTKIGGEGIFMVATDGEIASFGSFFPFNSTNVPGSDFGGSVTPYVNGTTVNLKLIYIPGDGVAATIPATMEFFVDGLSAGPQEIFNTENGVIDGSELGFYAQNAIDADNIATDAVVTTFTNISLTPLSVGIEGDLNDDGFVGIDDLNIVLGAWNQNVPPADPAADPSDDGFVGIDDLNVVLGNWNAGTPPSVNVVPEPATLSLIALGGVALLRRK
jgi:PEP-CTERM motif